MEKKWNSVLVSCIALLFIAITVVNVNLAFNSDSAIVLSLALVDIETLAHAESGDTTDYTCTSGGPGSSSCSVSINGSIGGGGGGTSCNVDCISGYYACCNAMQNKCQCRKY
jgi:hypothetical protein